MQENIPADNETVLGGSADAGAEKIENNAEGALTVDSNEDIAKKDVTSTKAFSQALNRLSEKKVEKALSEERKKYAGYDRMMSSLKGLGLGDDEDEIIALFKDNSFTDAVKSRISKELIDKSPVVEQARKIIDKATFKRDLELVNAHYPFVEADSIEDLGELFMSLMANGGVDAVSAYAAQLKYNELNEKKPPQSTGSVRSGGYETQKSFYTPQEAKNIPREAFRKNPSLMEKLRKSMAKW